MKLSEDGKLISEGIFRKESYYVIFVKTLGSDSGITLLEGCYDIMPYGISFVSDEGLSCDVITGGSAVVVEEYSEQKFREYLDNIGEIEGAKYIKTMKKSRV